MEIVFAPKGILQINDARIIFRNFAGRGDKFNREGDRNFALVIPTGGNLVDELRAEGWNVKVRPPREEGDDEFAYLPVKVKFNDRGPSVFLVTGERANKLEEAEVGLLDDIDISSVNLDIRPYDWNVNGKDGRTAYLQSMEVIQEVSRFEDKYRYLETVAPSDDDPDECPF